MMIRVTVDCSVFAVDPPQAVGRFFGEIEVLVVPRSGELISFPVVLPEVKAGSFPSQIAVEKIIHVPRTPDQTATVLVMLKDVAVGSTREANAVLMEMSKLPGFFSDYWDEQ